MANRLEGRAAIVTGASRGIGLAITEAFLREGARVVIAARKAEALEVVRERLAATWGDSVVACACHTGAPEDIERLLAFASDVHGTTQVLVNNAATNPYFGPMLHTPDGAWDKTLEVNLRGYFQLARGVAQGLIEAGKTGSIINVASIAGLASAPFQGIYGITKAGVISMTQTLAVELGAAGIRVNAIAPGLVETKLAAALTSNEDLVRLYTERAALKRYGQPAEIAGPAVFLAGDDSSYMTGQTLVVDGGYLVG